MGHLGFGGQPGLCRIFLFSSGVMDTQVKYAFGVIGIFVIAFCLEALVASRGVIMAREGMTRAKRLATEGALMGLTLGQQSRQLGHGQKAGQLEGVIHEAGCLHFQRLNRKAAKVFCQPGPPGDFNQVTGLQHWS